MTRIRIQPWTPRNDPVAATVGGALALAAALAAGLGSRLAPPVFGAVLALALAADWGLSALAESEATHRARGVALARWLLAGGWLSFGVLLLHTPLAYPDPMRVLITALIVVGSASRVLDRYERHAGLAAPGLAIVLFWAAAAIAVTWFGGSPALAANPVAAMAIAATFELLGTGISWLGSAWLALSERHYRPPAMRPIPQGTHKFSLSEK
jgi:hypothetical protein